MRQQLGRQRLGLIFGSGLSKDFGFPDWTTLLKWLAKELKTSLNLFLDRKRNGRVTNPLAAAEFLRQKLRESHLTASENTPEYFHQLRTFEHAWRQSVHKVLY